MSGEPPRDDSLDVEGTASEAAEGGAAAEGGTVTVSSDDAAALREQALPFGKNPEAAQGASGRTKRGASSNTTARASRGNTGTATMNPEEARALRAGAAMPFEGGGAKRDVPRTATMNPEEARALRAGAALPFEGGGAKRDVPRTATFTPDDARALRAEAALPFDTTAEVVPPSSAVDPTPSSDSGTLALGADDASALREAALLFRKGSGTGPAVQTPASASATRAPAPPAEARPTRQPTHAAHDATASLDVTHPGDLAVGTMAVMRGGLAHVVVIVKATAQLVADERAALLPAVPLRHATAWETGGGERFPSPWVSKKARADVVLAGHAHAPSPTVGVSAVSFSLGGPGNRFERKLVAFGDRCWQRRLLGRSSSEPAPFERMPLGYARAFGGPGYPKNPIGIGFDRGGKPESLPNLEDPDQLITSSDDQPDPASFAARPLRWDRPNDYDDTWHTSRAPLAPRSLDNVAVQQAPKAQQLDDLRGDEAYCCKGMAPDRVEIAGRLPGLRISGFVARRDGAELEEFALRLDTVAFDVDAHRVELVWRGAIEVRDSEASDVAKVLISSELLG